MKTDHKTQRRVHFGTDSKRKRITVTKIFFYTFLLLIILLMIVTYQIGLWTVELVYRPDVENGGIFSYHLPDFVLKTKDLKNWVPNDPQSQDLVSLMKDIKMKSYSDVTKPSCNQLFQGNLTAIKEGIIFDKTHTRTKLTDHSFVHLAKNCENFRKNYVTRPVSEEEADFPLAFSILVFEDAEQFEMLLRAIYRPQNYYCVHVDKKSKGPLHAAVRAITDCFNNVFPASKLVDVQWGMFSVLEPELICMDDLWKYPKWKYFINLTGKEYPLRTNLELVEILKVFKGANNMEATIKNRNSERTSYIHHGHDRTDMKKPPPPVPVTLTKGSIHITVSRAFVDYVLHDHRAVLFQEWITDTGIPDETFFSSLGHSPQLDVPGAYAGEPETDPETYPFFARFKNWGSWPFNFPCYGMRLRRICVFGVGDLQLLVSRPEFFANKFHLSFQPQTLQCLEEWMTERVTDEIAGLRYFNSSIYGNYDFVWNHI